LEQIGDCSTACACESISKQGGKVSAVQQAKAIGKEWSKHQVEWQNSTAVWPKHSSKPLARVVAQNDRCLLVEQPFLSK